MNRLGRARIWAGVGGAIALSWLSFAFVAWLSLWLLGYDAQAASLGDPPLSVIVLVASFCLSALPVTAFAAGLACAFLWHPVAARAECERWSLWVLMGFWAPTFIGGACCLAFFGFGPCLWVFNKGLDCGYKWWPEQKWREFFGWSNPWERDDDDPKSP